MIISGGILRNGGFSCFRATIRTPPLRSSKQLKQFKLQSSLSLRSMSTPAQLPKITQPAVSKWLYSISALIAGIVVVGGMTRLTESGLSITEWKPITGIALPRGDEWIVEFDKYKQTPEFKMLNSRIDLEDFKKIYMMEWAHRIFGRAIGVAFILPAGYFIARKQISRGMKWAVGGLGLGLGFQGFLGWYMVESGLKEENFAHVGAHPRVSQYRLSAHLGAALALYVATLYAAFAAARDFRVGRGGSVSGVSDPEKFLGNGATSSLRRFRVIARTGLGVVFLTALSGAFVAGLDAGLIYNEFPWMGTGITPPKAELWDPRYSQREDRSDLWWRNMLENPSTVQLDHRIMATTTLIGTLAMHALALRSPTMRKNLPPLTKKLLNLTTGVSLMQVTLGISTLLYLVPTPLAVSHQAGSVALLSSYVALVASLRRPGLAARIHQRFMQQQKKAV
ncbi:hypothetical protein E3Q23_04356 [Wallemia mellicola]|uniref:Cytochrome oxidase assembly n=1 Tax=Wallemia mellicola TaxID=1708541 RepID=A0A4T0U2H6_9BASI|nr:hypothetical protein E3Q23_04356 [Wallemia mellicola]TIB84660.1 cytochrome oxidase assembly [Wallemia mellicola]TIC06621.1 cytochrome oxidase assembly [Wallemia mellicola]TIC21504.1 cytochrome oxidase assembly [Wallemia mellicola]TIC23184.1 cytochrome oxidase assembly [Wallemia mellicola]